MTTTANAEALERLEVEHRQRVREIRQDPALSWEKKELAIKALGEDYHRTRKERMEAA